jgi:tripartite-type tricarboxylate transporter receptor subunit TctC
MKKKVLSVLMAMAMSATLFVGCGSTASSGQTASADAPTEEGAEAEVSNGGETVKIICGYGAGGTADLVARTYAKTANSLQSDYNFVVENMTGGDGFAAATFFADEDANTKDLLVFGYGLCYRHDLGKTYQTEEVDFDRTAMRPVGTVDDRTWILYTTPDQSLESILAKAKSEGVKMSGGNPLSDCHLEFGSLVALEGGKVTVVSGYDGGAEQKQGLVNSEVDVFVGTTQAAQDEVEAGTLIPILAFSDKAFEGFTTPDGAITVPTVVGEAKAPELDASVDFSSCILPAGGTLACHAGCDEGFYSDMTDIMKKVWESEDYYGWIESVMLNNFQVYGDDAQKFMDDACAKALKAYDNLK